MNALRRTLVGIALGGLVLGLAPSPADASSETLRRSLQNILLSPFDVVLSPVVAGISVRNGLSAEDDTPAVRWVYTGPGFLWQTGVQAGASFLRTVAGALELVPGIFLLPFETDLTPIYDLPEQRNALVDYELPFFHVRAGVDYVSPGGY